MKFTKTHGYILGAIVLFVVIYFVFFRKKAAESSYRGFIVPGVPAGPKFLQTSTGKVKYVGTITNTRRPCPQGSHSAQLPDGSYGCIQNVA